MLKKGLKSLPEQMASPILSLPDTEYMIYEKYMSALLKDNRKILLAIKPGKCREEQRMAGMDPNVNKLYLTTIRNLAHSLTLPKCIYQNLIKYLFENYFSS